MDEQALIANAQRGDVGAFEELVRRHQEVAFRTAYLIVRDAADAEDACQDALLRAYRALGRFRAGSAFRPWLLKIVANQALTAVRSRRRRADASERSARAEPPLAFDVDSAAIDNERARLVWRALESLREHERVVVYLRYFLALPERELAEYLGCAPGTVKSRLHRALAKLREVLVKEYPQLIGESI